MPDWGDVFRLSTPFVEVLVRGTVMFLAIFALMRVTGQRESGVHSLTDLLGWCSSRGTRRPIAGRGCLP